ncbi:MAG: hypothetical protein LBR97_02410 [Dysgonamonadaceae bacterium]|nr:hypothetical protein [Dysgonamonadaceae bacterium]
MNRNNLLITLFFAVMSFSCIQMSGQSYTRIPATDINKKTADEALTDSMSVFRCRHNNAADSIFNNLFDHYTKCKTIPIGILHRRYGLVTPEIDMSLQDFICMFMNDFDFYCAIDEQKNQMLNITLVLKHKIYDYIHMLLIHSSQQELTDGDKRIRADFYTYIPQHSVINNNK